MIRRINIGEGELYRKLRLEALQESPEAFTSTYEDALKRDPQSWQDQADHSASGSNRTTLIAFSGDDPIGLAALYRDENNPQIGDLIQVWLAPDHRGGSIAIDLMDEIFRWAAVNNFSQIRAEITPDNNHALRFYKRYGFISDDSGLILMKEV